MHNQHVHKDHVTLYILYVYLYKVRLFGLIIQNTLSCTLTSCLGCELKCKMYYLPVIKPINYIHLFVLFGKSDVVVDRLTV